MSTSRKRLGLWALATLLLALGAAGIYAGSHNYPIRALGVIAVITSAYVIRKSTIRDQAGQPQGRQPMSLAARHSTRMLWIVSLALVPLLAIALLLLQMDAAKGGHEAWPADVFAGVGFVCAVVWGWLFALSRR